MLLIYVCNPYKNIWLLSSKFVQLIDIDWLVLSSVYSPKLSKAESRQSLCVIHHLKPKALDHFNIYGLESRHILYCQCISCLNKHVFSQKWLVGNIPNKCLCHPFKGKKYIHIKILSKQHLIIWCLGRDVALWNRVHHFLMGEEHSSF